MDLHELQQRWLNAHWKQWERWTRELLKQQREACYPYSGPRLEEAEALLSDLLTCVRQADEAAVRMRNQFPGFPPKGDVTKE